MSSFNNDKVMPRYMMIAVLLTIIGIADGGCRPLETRQCQCEA